MADDTSDRIGAAIAGAALAAVGARAARATRTPEPEESAVPTTGFTDEDEAASPFVQRLDARQRDSRTFGFLWAVLKKFTEDRAGSLAALVAYFGFFSIFPLLVAMVSILGFVLEGDDDLREEITDTAFDAIPIVGNTLEGTIDSVEGSGILLVVGILLALWAGLRVIDAIQNALNEVWDLPRVRKVPFLVKRAKGLVTLGLVFVALVGSVAVNAVGSLLPGLPGAGRIAIQVGTIVLNMGVYVVLFRFLTAEKLPWRAHVPGGVLAGLSWWVMQTFGVLYLSQVEDSAGPTYGSFASTIVLLTFLYVSAQLIILSAEIGVVRYRRLWPRALPKCELTEADRRAWQDQAASTRQVPLHQVISRI